ncbi:hypothetical protein [Cryobacterium sp. TMT2-14]|uniref:P-loop ATPase, Sll1717 family n=1 Tax=Cryobacterium sp. TMT2-14 TaxID=1259245 RepID=UPI00106D789E|nr:hypothetical protein [Cryobacterium sp. TMT2-14]TFC36406.1 hypothetical protein E3O28_08815 [Cryobacterium sp. TMT2-14]
MGDNIFFGYPEYPTAQAEVMRATALGLRAAGENARTWQDLEVDGKLVIQQVLRAIDECDMAVFDLTLPNPNVLFEAGYAVGRGKPLWFVLDSTSRSHQRLWEELAILKEVGYTSYRNSQHLLDKFARQNPVQTLTAIYDDIIEPVLPENARERRSLFYCSTFEPFEASNRLSNLVDERRRRGLDVVVSDPSESSLNPITWFAPRIASAAGMLIHFAGPDRNRSVIHNNRHAFVGGLGLGLDTPVLMVAEGDYPAPFDYETQLSRYTSAEECLQLTREWLGDLTFEGIAWGTPRKSLQSQLGGIRFGEHVAENERAELADYFLETSGYHDVVAARDTIFIGHRGTGKTANASQAFEHVSANKTNLAILIKPPSFEFPAILAAVQKLPDLQHDYFFDSMWQFLIQTEVAAALLLRLRARNKSVPFSVDEQGFLDFVDGLPYDMTAELSVRLEQALAGLMQAMPDSGETDRNLINEAFHASSLAALRAQLGPVLKGKKRVAVFIDNLDKGWERGADFRVMARFILGLLTARGRVVMDFERHDYWRDTIKLTVAIFLRSDIYTYLRSEAREPDKLPISTIAWKDHETLRAVVEARFLTSEAKPGVAQELWQDYFANEVAGEPTADYLLRVTLPRPRDIVFFCNAAVARAVDRLHDRVLEEDFLEAESVYSQYAYEALLVENGVTIPEMEESLLAFIDSEAIASTGSRREALLAGGLAEERLNVVLKKLTSMSFFGVETAANVFEFPEVGSETKLAEARASKLEPRDDARRLQVHAAYHRFLGIQTSKI